MSKPTNKEEFKTYILRKLGSEYVPIEISDEQMNDIIEYAMTFFAENYYGFSKDVVIKIPYDEYLRAETGGTAPLENVFQWDMSGHNILAVTEILPMTNIGLFNYGPYVTSKDVEWVFSIQQLQFYDSFDLELQYENLSMFKNLFMPRHIWNFNQNEEILRLYSMGNQFSDFYIIANVLFDTFKSGKLWQNKKFIDYVFLLSNKQWYNNLRKFKGVLPGGIELNMDAIKEEMDKLPDFEQDIIDNYADMSITMSINMR